VTDVSFAHKFGNPSEAEARVCLLVGVRLEDLAYLEDSSLVVIHNSLVGIQVVEVPVRGREVNGHTEVDKPAWFEVLDETGLLCYGEFCERDVSCESVFGQLLVDKLMLLAYLSQDLFHVGLVTPVEDRVFLIIHEWEERQSDRNEMVRITEATELHFNFREIWLENIISCEDFWLIDW
jgi:hypothetical protein